MRFLAAEFRRLRATFESYDRDDGSLMAAAAAYFIGLSLFPLLSVLIACLGWFLRHTYPGQDAQQQVMQAVEHHVSPVVAGQVGELLGQIQDRSPIVGPVGLVTLLLTVMAGFAQFERAFDRIWNVPVRESGGWISAVVRVLFSRLVAFLMLLTIGAIVFLTFVGATLMATLQAKTSELLPAPAALWTVAQSSVSIVINVGAFSLLYRWLPKAAVPWKPALRGAVLVAIAWEIGRQALAAFLIGTKYSSAYGIVGTFLGVLVWCYYACTILFLGAEYVQRLVEEQAQQVAARDAARLVPPSPGPL
jgi:membrane protein